MKLSALKSLVKEEIIKKQTFDRVKSLITDAANAAGSYVSLLKHTKTKSKELAQKLKQLSSDLVTASKWFENKGEQLWGDRAMQAARLANIVASNTKFLVGKTSLETITRASEMLQHLKQEIKYEGDAPAPRKVRKNPAPLPDKLP